MIHDAAPWIAGGSGVVALLALAVAGLLWRRVLRLTNTQRILLPSGATGDLLERQGELRAALTALEAALSGLDRRVVSGAESTAQELARSIHFQGLIRYNAYRDMGGQQSWSIALLNAAQTGTVITCLHARDHARVYLKEIVAGSSEQRLSPEEMRAIHTAMAS